MERPKKKRSVLNIVLIAAAAALLVAGAVLLISENVLFSEPYVAPPTPAPTPVQTAAPTLPPDSPHTPAPTPTLPPYVKPVPVHIYFTTAQVSCEIVPVGLNENGEMATLDSATQAAWYEPGPAPGEAGNALLNGHVRWKRKKGTFSVLLDAKEGDEVAIEFADGSYKYFTMDSVETYHYTEIPDDVMYMGGENRVTLITCLGDFNNDLGMSESRVVAVLHEK